jgi:xylulokinase
VDIERFEEQIANAPAGSDGVLTLPFFNGERTPNMPRAKGCVFGIDAQNARPENLLRSSAEGACFALKYGIDRLATLGVSGEEIVLTGGGSKSATWRQIIADVCGLPVFLLTHEEGAAFGAALQALELISQEPLISIVEAHVVRRADLRCDPDPEAVCTYLDVYEEYLRAVDTITPYYSTD